MPKKKTKDARIVELVEALFQISNKCKEDIKPGIKILHIRHICDDILTTYYLDE